MFYYGGLDLTYLVFAVPALLLGLWAQSAVKSRFSKYDKILTKYWTRHGPWLFPKIPQEKYESFVQHCLDCELVVSPFFSVPSIVPFGADSGVFKKLEKSPFDF